MVSDNVTTYDNLSECFLKLKVLWKTNSVRRVRSLAARTEDNTGTVRKHTPPGRRLTFKTILEQRNMNR